MNRSSSPLEADRCLRTRSGSGGDHQEGSLQSVGRPVCCDLTFLHGLQQGGLRLRRCAVDLVGQNEIGEDRTGAESRHAPSGAGEDRTGDVHRHEVGVNWIRANHSPILANERAMSVFATPGTSSIRRARRPGSPRGAVRARHAFQSPPVPPRLWRGVRGRSCGGERLGHNRSSAATNRSIRSRRDRVGLTWGRGWDRSMPKPRPEQPPPFPAVAPAIDVTGGKPVGGQPAQSGSRRCSASKPVVAKATARSNRSARPAWWLRQLPVLAVSWARSGNRATSPPPRHPNTHQRQLVDQHFGDPIQPKQRDSRRARRAGRRRSPRSTRLHTLAPIRPALPRRRPVAWWSPGATRRPGALEDPGQGEARRRCRCRAAARPGPNTHPAPQGRRPHPASARVCSMAA